MVCVTWCLPVTSLQLWSHPPNSCHIYCASHIIHYACSSHAFTLFKVLPHLLLLLQSLLSHHQPSAPRRAVLISPQPMKPSVLGAMQGCPTAEKDNSAFKIGRTYVKLERQLAAADVCSHAHSTVRLYSTNVRLLWLVNQCVSTCLFYSLQRLAIYTCSPQELLLKAAGLPDGGAQLKRFRQAIVAKMARMKNPVTEPSKHASAESVSTHTA